MMGQMMPIGKEEWRGACGLIFSRKSMGVSLFCGSVRLADHACMAHFFPSFSWGMDGWNVALSFVLCVTHGPKHCCVFFCLFSLLWPK